MRACAYARTAPSATTGDLIDDLDLEPSQGRSMAGDGDTVVELRPAETKPKRARSVETLWPDSLALGDYERAYAETHGYRGVEATRLWARFEAHARSKGSRYVDWSRAWQKWVQNEVKYDGQRHGGPKRPLLPDAPNDPVLNFPGGFRRSTSFVRDAVATFAKCPRKWPHEIGPPPGTPGCLVPKHLLATGTRSA